MGNPIGGNCGLIRGGGEFLPGDLDFPKTFWDKFKGYLAPGKNPGRKGRVYPIFWGGIYPQYPKIFWNPGEKFLGNNSQGLFKKPGVNGDMGVLPKFSPQIWGELSDILPRGGIFKNWGILGWGPPFGRK